MGVTGVARPHAAGNCLTYDKNSVTQLHTDASAARSVAAIALMQRAAATR